IPSAADAQVQYLHLFVPDSIQGLLIQQLVDVVFAVTGRHVTEYFPDVKVALAHPSYPDVIVRTCCDDSANVSAVSDNVLGARRTRVVCLDHFLQLGMSRVHASVQHRDFDATGIWQLVRVEPSNRAKAPLTVDHRVRRRPGGSSRRPPSGNPTN